MAIRRIVEKGDSLLLKPSRVVEHFNRRLHTLLDDMRETLEQAQGLGLAAVQVGVLRRVVLVLDIENEELIELINPVITTQSGEQDGAEGCLSVPGLYGMVSRPMEVTVAAQNRHGKYFTVTGQGLTARAFCHELEHLDGKLFLDKVSRYLTEEELAQG